MARSFTWGVACGLFCLLLMGSGNIATCRVTVKLIDSGSGGERAGLLRVTDAEGEPLAVEGLLNRGVGLPGDEAVRGWWVMNGPATLTLPRQKVVLEAIAGLDTELARLELDLTGQATATASLSLKPIPHPAAGRWRSGNTHLHLMKLDREASDRYLREIPKADGLDLLFVSYLERAEADRDYITNRYTRAQLAELGQAAGVPIGNGEEHRHNFSAQSQGYGHVMFLDLPELVLPVSIGPGITKQGTDGLPIQRGIDQAHRQKATVVWCHNSWGLEHLPCWATGRIDAQNIFDGGTHGSYKDSFYRLLNAGFKVPFSTGTDWFMYDFSRVYVPLDGPPTVPGWLAKLKEGKSYITNGPLFAFEVEGQGLGETVKKARGEMLNVSARVVGRVDFKRLEVVQNGRVVRTAASEPRAGHFVAEAKFSLPVDGSGWLGLRVPPPPVKGDAELSEAVPLNELGKPLFGHTSPIYLDVPGRPLFDEAVTRQLLQEVERNIAEIEKTALFADPSEKSRVLEVHQEGARALRTRLEMR